MAGNKLMGGIVTGALIGAAFSLLDKETRISTKQSLLKCKEKMTNVISHPVDTVETFNENLVKMNKRLRSAADDVVFVLEKVQQVTNSTERNIKKLKDSEVKDQ